MLFENLDRNYDLILADPPWAFKARAETGLSKSPQKHYACMKWEDIACMEVERLAAKNCWLLLWATAPLLPEALAVLRCWGFQYKSHIVWAKKFPSGKKARGLGFIARTEHEILLIGKKGAPKRGKPFDSVIDGVRREHSRKPEEVYAAIDNFLPHARRKCELFARCKRNGWDVWGNETDKFGAAAA